MKLAIGFALAARDDDGFCGSDRCRTDRRDKFGGGVDTNPCMHVDATMDQKFVVHNSALNMHYGQIEGAEQDGDL